MADQNGRMHPPEHDPFIAYADAHPVGTRVRARVVDVRPFGAFCALDDGVEGLLLVVDFAGAASRPDQALSRASANAAARFAEGGATRQDTCAGEDSVRDGR